jgi:EspG family
MAVTVGRGEILHPVEVDLLCTFAEVVPPFPLEIDAVGETDIERAIMFAGAREQLTERGLADEDGPLGVADDFVYLLRNATGVLDLVLAQETRTLGAAVLSYRDEALLVTQDAADPAAMVRMKALSLDDAVEDLLRLIPAMDPSMAAPFNLPRQAVQNAFSTLASHMPEEDGAAPDPLRSDEVDELLRTHGIDERVARRMVQYLQPVLGNGQAGIAKRDQTEDQWHRSGTELSWLDTPKGRFRLAEDGEWISVNPLSTDEIRAGLRKLAASVRG